MTADLRADDLIDVICDGILARHPGAVIGNERSMRSGAIHIAVVVDDEEFVVSVRWPQMAAFSGDRRFAEAVRALGRPYPSWCCQTCGGPVGYVGRFFQWCRLPLHRCEDYR